MNEQLLRPALTVGSLFSGIGGIDLGLERAGMEVRWQCEIDSYCRSILNRHWPHVRCFEDIHDIDESAERVDVIAGGFPCQPVSLAGKGLAQKDPRWLWPEFARVVGVLRPSYVIVENVPGLVRRGLADVVGDLAAMGYDAEWQIVSAASVGAPHLRERVFVVAYSDGNGEHDGPLDAEVAVASQSLADATGGRSPEALLQWKQESERHAAYSSWWVTEPEVGRVADGVPDRVAQLRALGNAVVPQVAEFVGRLLVEAA